MKHNFCLLFFLVLSATAWSDVVMAFPTDIEALSERYQSEMPFIKRSQGSPNAVLFLKQGQFSGGLHLNQQSYRELPFVPPFFKFDTEEYRLKYQSVDLRNAKIRHALKTDWDWDGYRYRWPGVFLNSWGALFHPPTLLEESHEDSHYDVRYWQKKKTGEQFSPDFQKRLDRLTDSQLLRVEKIELLQDKAFFAGLSRLIDNSQKFLFINMLAGDCQRQSEKEIFTKIRQKAKSGTRVWLAIDGLFSYLSRSCYESLKKEGIQVTYLRDHWWSVRPLMHSSFYVNDQDELVLGSQNIYWGFLESTGINQMDRDLSLYVQGAVATEAVKESMAVWFRGSPPAMSLEAGDQIIAWLKEKKKEELAQGYRGPSHYEQWFEEDRFETACRFVAQRPQGEKRDLEIALREHLRASKNSVSISSVKFLVAPGDNKIVSEFLSLMKQKNLSVDFFGNGVDGGNGELTIEVNDWIRQIDQGGTDGLSWWKRLKRTFLVQMSRNAYKNHADINFENYRLLLENPNLQIWLHSNFVHHKVWEFDHHAFAVTSALFADRTFNEFYDSGLICYKSGLISRARSFDLLNSVPITAESVRPNKNL